MPNAVTIKSRVENRFGREEKKGGRIVAEVVLFAAVPAADLDDRLQLGRLESRRGSLRATDDLRISTRLICTVMNQTTVLQAR